MTASAASTWFAAGSIAFVVAGAIHGLASLIDTVRPRFFAPIEPSVLPALERTGIRFRELFPGGAGRPSMWRAWLGFNIGHGLGLLAFGALCLLVSVHDFDLVEEIDAMRPLTLAVSAAYLVVSLRFWFYAPTLLLGTGTICFAIATALSL